VELVAHVDEVTTVCVTDNVLVSGVYMAARDGVIAVWVTATGLESDVCLVVGDGTTAVWVTARVGASDCYVAATVENSRWYPLVRWVGLVVASMRSRLLFLVGGDCVEMSVMVLVMCRASGPSPFV
jgi:hypothetical protein